MQRWGVSSAVMGGRFASLGLVSLSIFLVKKIMYLRVALRC